MTFYRSVWYLQSDKKEKTEFFNQKNTYDLNFHGTWAGFVCVLKSDGRNITWMPTTIYIINFPALLFCFILSSALWRKWYDFLSQSKQALLLCFWLSSGTCRDVCDGETERSAEGRRWELTGEAEAGWLGLHPGGPWLVQYVSHSWGKTRGWMCRCGVAMKISPGQGGVLGNLVITMSWKRKGKGWKIPEDLGGLNYRMWISNRKWYSKLLIIAQFV